MDITLAQTLADISVDQQEQIQAVVVVPAPAITVVVAS
jgi:hypothetical protein